MHAYSLLKDAARKADLTEREIILAAALSGRKDGRMPDIDRAVRAYQECHEIPDWVGDFALKILTGKIPLITGVTP